MRGAAVTGRHWRAVPPRKAAGALRTLAAAACGLGAAVLAAGAAGWAAATGLGLAVGVATWTWLRRQPSPARREEDRRIAADLPYAADLLAAALRAGAPPDAAAGAVGEAIGGPVGERLLRVGRALRIGAGPAEAWAHLAEEQTPNGSTRLAGAAVRSHGSGAALSATFTALAEELRAARVAAGEAAAKRAGVLVVLPLGLCFLPAFVLAGLVPVIVAVLGDVLP